VREKIAGAAKLSPGRVTISPSVRKDRRSGEAFAGMRHLFAECAKRSPERRSFRR